MLTKWYPNRYDPQFGVFIQKHARAIAREADISVFYAQSDEKVSSSAPVLETDDRDGVREYKWYYRKSSGPFAGIINALRYFRCFRLTWIKIVSAEGKPDILHAYILLRTALVAWWVSLRYSIPFLVSEQWSGYATGSFQKKPSLLRWLSTFVANKAGARTAVSEFLKGKMISVGFREPIMVVPNIIEVRPPAPVHLLNRQVKLLVVADLVDEIKNISGVIRAMAALHTEFPEIQLHIIGGGKDKTALTELSEAMGLLDKTVFFEGMKSNEEVYSALEKCSFLIVNSRFETFSLICAEALSCGKPVIATRCGGPEEIIAEGTGYLIPVNDDAALVSAIRKMIHNLTDFKPEFLTKYSNEHFSPEHAAEKFRQVYKLL